MELDRFVEIVSKLKEGDLIEIVHEPDSEFYSDHATGEKQDIREPYYFAGRTKVWITALFK